MPLAAQGFTIYEAADGSAAWQIAVQNRPWIILADISMPEVDGFEFCRRVRNHPMLERRPLLFISGSDKYKERYRALQIGADDFLAKNMPVAGSDRLLEGGCWALVGPTGAGKTTTVAKLAARWVDTHGPDSVGIIGIDGYRVGAREQLRAHARILGVKMRVAATARDLGKALESMQGRRLVLIDTAGLGQRDLRMGEQQALMASAPGRFGTLLVLPATAELAVLDEIVRAHAALAPAGCILTKVDESPGLAPALSAVMRANLELFYMCDGQRGPENLHFAGAKRPWLVWQATKPRHRPAAANAPEPVARAL
jgi:flagellar biosynthesis protein FlhF